MILLLAIFSFAYRTEARDRIQIMRPIVQLALPFLAMLLFASFADAEEMLLVCQGIGQKKGHQFNSMFLQDNQGNFVTGNSWGSGGVVSTDEMLKVRISGGSGAIQFPKDLLPLIHGSSKDGWFTFTKLNISEEEIAATFSLNFINHPSVTIDRLTGGISIAGLGGGFNGACEKFDPATMKKKF